MISVAFADRPCAKRAVLTRCRLAVLVSLALGVSVVAALEVGGISFVW